VKISGSFSLQPTAYSLNPLPSWIKTGKIFGSKRRPGHGIDAGLIVDDHFKDLLVGWLIFDLHQASRAVICPIVVGWIPLLVGDDAPIAYENIAGLRKPKHTALISSEH